VALFSVEQIVNGLQNGFASSREQPPESAAI
jgi:hypothetical protein